jgi:hypothetical protein
VTQPDLFAPQTARDIAAARRDTGIARASDHARRVDPAWLEKALGYVRLHAMVATAFLTEDVRAMAEADGLPDPPDGRAWGAVMRTAKHRGIVRAAGYAPAKSSNLSPKVWWAAVRPGDEPR